MVSAELKGDTRGYRLAEEALNLAWRWEGGEAVRGDALAEIVATPEGGDIGDLELYYEDEGMKGAAIAITLAVSYVGRQAYKLERAATIPSHMEEISEETLEWILSFAARAASFDEDRVEQLTSFLESINPPGASEELGRILARHEILQVIKG